jgi:hypothetical protein
MFESFALDYPPSTCRTKRFERCTNPQVCASATFHLGVKIMTNDPNKQQGQHDQTQPKQQGQNPTGSVNPADKSKENPSPNSGYDSKVPQDISKKDPSRGHDSTDRQNDRESEQDNKQRRAS